MAMAQSRSLSVLRGQCWLWSRRMCSDQPAIPARRPVPAVSVQDERVQALLVQLTGMDLDKVFAARKEPLRPPTYKLLTKKELEKVEHSTVEHVCHHIYLISLSIKNSRGKHNLILLQGALNIQPCLQHCLWIAFQAPNGSRSKIAVSCHI